MTDITQEHYFDEIASNLYSDQPATEAFEKLRKQISDVVNTIGIFRSLGAHIRAAVRLRPTLIECGTKLRRATDALSFMEMDDIESALPYGVLQPVSKTIGEKIAPSVDVIISITQRLTTMSATLGEITNRKDTGITPRPVFNEAFTTLYDEMITRDKRFYDSSAPVPTTFTKNFTSIGDFVECCETMNTLNEMIDRFARPADIERLMYRIDSLVKSLVDKIKRGDVRDETKAVISQDVEAAAKWVEWIGITLNTQCMLTYALNTTVINVMGAAKLQALKERRQG